MTTRNLIIHLGVSTIVVLLILSIIALKTSVWDAIGIALLALVLTMPVLLKNKRDNEQKKGVLPA